MSHDDSIGKDLHDRNGSHLEALLREEARYLEDDGFTERVLASLPARAAGSRSRPWILAISALLAALVGGYAIQTLAQGMQSPLQVPLPVPGASTMAWDRLVEWLFLAFTWAPEGLPAGVPVIPVTLGLIALTGAVLWTRHGQPE